MSVPIKTVWHASRADIPKPTLTGRTVGEHHDNSGLGLFCANVPDPYIIHFGNYIFALDLIDDVRRLTMTITQFATLSRAPNQDRAWFEQYGRELAQQYDVIHIQELDGQLSQTIILSDTAIEQVRRYTPEEFLVYLTPKTSSPGRRQP